MPQRTKPKAKAPQPAPLTVNTIPRLTARNKDIAIHLDLSVNENDKWIVGGEIFWIDRNGTTFPRLNTKNGSLGSSKLKPVKFNTYDKAMKRVRRLAKHNKHLRLTLHGFELDEVPSGDGHNG